MYTIFIDTEFTSLNANRMRGLISIGCVSQDGREFYAELSDTWDESMCSIFVINTVLPLLEGGAYVMGIETLAVRLKAWIEALTDKQVVMVSDAPALDFQFVKEIFDYHGWPKNLRQTPAGIAFEDIRQKFRFDMGLASYFKENGAHQHHALVDARGLKFAFNFATASRKPPRESYHK
jgi:hypothetical protein